MEPVRVRLLGPFSVTWGGRAAGPWPRPSARRLCEFVLVSPGRRVSRDLVCEALFPGLDPHTAARSVSKALSMARATLARLGGPAASVLAADLGHIWVSPDAEVDAEAHERALRAALAMEPGPGRDDRLVAALAQDGELLADEPYADWALRPRERLDALRQEARLALARDRARGAGRSRPETVAAAWESCFEHDQASEEAAGALMRAYFADGRRELATRVYERCRAALEELGLGISPSLAEAYATASAQAQAQALPPAPVAPREELRTVTVLSAEVAAPTTLSPESLRDLVSRCLTAVIAEVEALAGTVTSVSGHGLQAMFGAPEAHEDDPERAARAAFRALSTMPGKALRIGVETGPAVLGPIGGGARVEYGAVGEVVGLAAALQALARPGSALVGPVTRTAIEHLFTWGTSEGGASYLGQPRPRAAGRRPGRGRLVGRQAEMALLGTALREAARGRGSVVLVTGEPGLGKTRLVQECRTLAARVSGRAPVWLEGRSASYISSTPYGLYRQLLAGWAGVTPDQPEAAVRPALEKALTTVMGNNDLFPVLARMMGLSPGAALGRMGPGELQRATFAAWRSVVSRLVAAAPVVLVVEDLHWADPTSVRLTLDLAGLAEGRRLLLLATSRPEAAPEVAGLGTGHRIVLRPLPGAAGAELARSLMGETGETAGPEVLDAVLASAEGNPLYLEERLASLLESGALVREHGVWRLNATAGHPMPQALERLVRSRVDRLSPAARDAVRPASVLGAEFPLSLLTAVCGADRPLGPALDELCARDLLQQVGRRPEPVYRFRHSLIQEATYNGLLRAERRLLHGRAAWAIEAASAGRAGEAASVLGRHFAAAGEAARALRYFEMAGDHATAAFANDEAVSSFRAALQIADDSVDLRAKLANVLWRTGRRAEAREAFGEALRLADTGDTLRRAHLLIRLGRLEMADLRFDAAVAAFDAAGALLGADPGNRDAATAAEWLELMADGRAALHTMRHEPEAALAALDAARPVLEAAGTPARKYAYHMHLAMARVMQNGYRVTEADIAAMREGVAAAAQGEEEKDLGYAMYHLGILCWLRGDLDAAGQHTERALAMAERIGEIILLGQSLLGLAMISLRRHDTEAVRAYTTRVMAMADAMARSEYLAGVKACLAWLAWQERRHDDVIKLSDEIEVLLADAVGSGAYRGLVYLWPLIGAHLDTGNVAGAVAAARRLRHDARPRLPGDLQSQVAAAVAAWDQGRPESAGEMLAAALATARERHVI